MGYGREPLFKGVIATTTTKYVGVPIRPGPAGGSIGLHIGWKDAVSAATITLELSSFPTTDAPIEEAGSAWEWKDSGLTITGPTAAAASSSLVNLENVRQLRARLKIVTTAACDFEIHNGAAA